MKDANEYVSYELHKIFKIVNVSKKEYVGNYQGWVSLRRKKRGSLESYFK